MVNIPGNVILPGAVSEIITGAGGSVLGAVGRQLALVGTGARHEVLVSYATGGGRDGFSSNYTSSTNPNGRRFKTSFFPLVPNRTVVTINGIPKTLLEEAIDGNSFSSIYDVRVDTSTGQIELQAAALVDQGGTFYSASTLNQGNGNISSLSLLDPNAPTETWTARCISVRRDGYGDPIDGYAKFIAQGTVSGVLLDGYGNQVTWQSNGVVVNNGLLEFAINEGASSFLEGDKFTIKVKSGGLSRGDSLVVDYIGVLDINDPEFFTDDSKLYAKHGRPSLDNTLSLGAQIAFANRPNGIWACQAAPSIPRRVSYILEESASGNAAADDLSFAFPVGVVPDADTNINFFVTDPVTGVETQLIPNKVPFYDGTIAANPNTFFFGAAYTYSYTVILDPNYLTVKQGDDGTLTNINGSTATLSSNTVTFNTQDASANRRVEIKTPNVNAGVYEVVSVAGGIVTIQRVSGSFTNESNVEFEVLDVSGESARVLFTDDLAFGAGATVRATVVDTKDADFYDVGWQNAYEALEAIEVSTVVPLPKQTISACIAGARAHVESMSTIKSKKERVLITGAIRGLTVDNVTGVEAAAVEDIGVLEGIQGDDVTEILAGDVEDLADYSVPNAYGNTFRVFYMYPDEIVVQIGADNVKVDGFYMAAALGGYLSGSPAIQIPTTRKTLTGFTILRDKLYRDVILERLVQAGICVVQPSPGGGKIVWGKTTTQSGFPEEEEQSIVYIRDQLAKDLRASFDGFVGDAEDDTTQGSMMVRADKAFGSAQGRKLITNYKDVKVVRDSIEPRQWNVSGKAQPTYGVNWVYIQVQLGVL